MTDQPFGADPARDPSREPAADDLASALGGGGFDMGALLEQAQQMQQQMMAAQEELANAEVDGTVADGLVTVTVSGSGELRGVKIRRGSFDPDDTEDLEDLIVAAYRDARSRADELAAETFGPLASGLGPLGGDLGGGGAGSGGPGGLPLGF
jgi:DNA-binding YbaB/EbfC family protein